VSFFKQVGFYVLFWLNGDVVFRVALIERLFFSIRFLVNRFLFLFLVVGL